MDAYDLKAVLARFEAAVSEWDCSLEDAGLTIGDLCVAIRSMKRELSTGVVPPFVFNTSAANQPPHTT